MGPSLHTNFCKFRDHGEVERSPRSPMEARRSVTPESLEKLTEIINLDHTKSTRKITEELNTSRGNVQRVLKEGLKRKSYVIKTYQLFEGRNEEICLTKSVKHCIKLMHPKEPNMLCFFGDKTLLPISSLQQAKQALVGNQSR